MSMRLHRLNFDRRGDTIVEVMVVLAVLGLALGISYATASRSLLNERQAQEHAQATEYVQNQLEDLVVLAPGSTSLNTTNNIFTATKPFCLYGAPSNTMSLTVDATPTFDATDVCAAFDSAHLYTILIYNCNDATLATQAPCSTAGTLEPDTLIAQATWADVLGQGTDSVTLSYRTHADE